MDEPEIPQLQESEVWAPCFTQFRFSARKIPGRLPPGIAQNPDTVDISEHEQAKPSISTAPTAQQLPSQPGGVRNVKCRNH